MESGSQPKKVALIVASDTYQDPGLRQLRAPGRDAQVLAEVLGDPEIGGFDVTVSFNESYARVNPTLERFFDNRRRDDVLLVHFSCHGLKDAAGRLYFATTDTDRQTLQTTSVTAELVNTLIARCRSRNIVLLLDCCYSGAYAREMLARSDGAMDVMERFTGSGRAVLTASSALEYSFEGDTLNGIGKPSFFTRAIVQGLKTGDADRDGDNWISIDELYDYVYDELQRESLNQTPQKMVDVQGRLLIARRARPLPPPPSEIPPDLLEAIKSADVEVRIASIPRLKELAMGLDVELATSARSLVVDLLKDDSRRVVSRVHVALREIDKGNTRPTSPVPMPAVPASPEPAPVPSSATVSKSAQVPAPVAEVDVPPPSPAAAAPVPVTTVVPAEPVDTSAAAPTQTPRSPNADLHRRQAVALARSAAGTRGSRRRSRPHRDGDDDPGHSAGMAIGAAVMRLLRPGFTQSLRSIRVLPLLAVLVAVVGVVVAASALMSINQGWQGDQPANTGTGAAASSAASATPSSIVVVPPTLVPVPAAAPDRKPDVSLTASPVPPSVQVMIGTPRELPFPNRSIYDAAFSPDGVRVAFVLPVETVMIWTWENEKSEPVECWIDPANPPTKLTSIDYTRVGNTDRILITAENGDALVCHSAVQTPTRHPWNFYSLGVGVRGISLLAGAISLDGTRSAVGGGDGTVKVMTREQVSFTLNTGKAVKSVAFSQDGKQIITGSAGGDEPIRVWSVEKPEEYWAPPASRDQSITDVAIDATGAMIAAAAENEPVRLWLGRGTEPRTLTADANANPRSVSFSPNGKLLATAGGDGVIRIYDTATASLAGSYVAANIKDQSVNSVRFSRDGKALVSAGNGGMVRVFRIEEKRS